jgi:hypothetical protein
MTIHESPREAMLNHQSAIRAAKARLATLQDAIEQQQGILEGLRTSRPDFASLEQEFESALAGQALGSIGANEVEQIQRQIDTARKASATLEPKVVSCERTIAGLQRKVQSETETISALDREMPYIIKKHLLAEAAQVAETYLQDIKPVIEAYQRLEGIGRLLHGLGHVPSLVPHGASFELPAFNLPAFNGKTVFQRPGLIFKVTTNADLVPWIDAEVERIRALGVDFK